MEEKDFDELLFEEKKNPKGAKNIIVGAIVVVAILIIVLIVWSFTKKPTINTSDSQDVQMEQIQDETDRGNRDVAKSEQDDRFEQIMKDVRNSMDKGEDANRNHDMQPEEQGLNASNLQTPDPQLQSANAKMGKMDQKPAFEDTQMEAPSMKTPEPMPMSKSAKETRAPKSGMDRLGYSDQNTVPTPSEVMKKKAESKLSSSKTNKHAAKPKSVAKPQVAKPQVTIDPQMQGTVATKGSYLQVGVFSKEPSKDLSKLLKKHPYRTQKTVINGQELTKYLIGPFENRAEANRYKVANPDIKFSFYYQVQ